MAVLAEFHEGKEVVVSGAGLGRGVRWLIPEASAEVSTESPGRDRDALPPEPLGEGLAPAPFASH